MCAVDAALNVKNEADALAAALSKGDPEASLHLARLIEADTNGVFQPFAQALAARLRNYVDEWAEAGVTDLDQLLEDVIYHLLKTAARDWDGRPHPCEPGEGT